MDESAIDVTQRILNRHIVYGASDSTQPQYLSANRSLNYAEGGSITKPETDNVSIIPFQFEYKDAVGLFGKENHFVKVIVNIDPSITFKCFEEEGWECAHILEEDLDPMSHYQTEIIDINLDLTTVNTYEPAEINVSGLPDYSRPVLSVDLANLKTGNHYIDNWFDVRLYTRSRKEHPYDKMYVNLRDIFYIGFHARNTKRLPYNVTCSIGQQYIPISSLEDDRYLNK
jgi:hypothetical protein